MNECLICWLRVGMPGRLSVACTCCPCGIFCGACAGLQTYVNFFTLCAHASTESKCSELMARAIDASHGDVIGWWGRKTIALACKATPEWEVLSQRIGPSRAETERDAKQWCDNLGDVLVALRALQREFDFEDKRRSA